MLRSLLSNLDQIHEALFAFSEALHDGFLGELGEVLILDNKVVKVVSEIIGARCSTMAIKHTKEANLRPIDRQVSLALRL